MINWNNAFFDEHATEPKQDLDQFTAGGEIIKNICWPFVLVLRWSWWPPVARQWFGGHPFERFSEQGKSWFALLCFAGFSMQIIGIGYLAASIQRFGFVSTPLIRYAAIAGLLFAVFMIIRIVVYVWDEFDWGS